MKVRPPVDAMDAEMSADVSGVVVHTCSDSERVGRQADHQHSECDAQPPIFRKGFQDTAHELAKTRRCFNPSKRARLEHRMFVGPLTLSYRVLSTPKKKLVENGHFAQPKKFEMYKIQLLRA